MKAEDLEETVMMQANLVKEQQSFIDKLKSQNAKLDALIKHHTPKPEEDKKAASNSDFERDDQQLSLSQMIKKPGAATKLPATPHKARNMLSPESKKSQNTLAINEDHMMSQELSKDGQSIVVRDVLSKPMIAELEPLDKNTAFAGRTLVQLKSSDKDSSVSSDEEQDNVADGPLDVV